MINKIRIADLPIAKTLKGLFTVGVDSNNSDVKVDLGFVEEAAETANAAATTANKAAQAADTARENIAGDLAQKSSMFTGAIMGKGKFYSADETILFKGDRTVRIVFKTGNDVQNAQTLYRDGTTNYGISASISAGLISVRSNGSEYTTYRVSSNYLYELILVKDGDGCLFAFNGDIKTPSCSDPREDATMFLIGSNSNNSLVFQGTVISAQLFNFAFSRDNIADSWNGGHPELWREPDAWRKEDSPQRVVVDLIPASITPTVWKDISGQGNDIHYVPFDSNPAECEMAYENMGFEDPMIRTVAPSVVPNFIWQRYVDTTNGALYVATGMNKVLDWKPL